MIRVHAAAAKNLKNAVEHKSPYAALRVKE
jgi:hypothetical protein